MLLVGLVSPQPTNHWSLHPGGKLRGLGQRPSAAQPHSHSLQLSERGPLQIDARGYTQATEPRSVMTRGASSVPSAELRDSISCTS